MEEENIMTLNDFMEIVKRRKKAIIWPALLIFITAALVAFLIPRTYRSTSTILIEEQEIPREYVLSTVTGYADQRLQSINQRIMSSTRLLEIINRFNLYTDIRGKWTIEEIIDKMRKDIKLETISADMVDRRSGRPAAATIAFSVSYDGRKPDVVQQVANILASLYLDESLKVREQQTLGASKFIEDEMKSVQANLADLDAKMADFKSKNLNTLPELMQLNLQNLDRMDRDIAQLNDQLRTLKEKEIYLDSQLVSTDVEMKIPSKEKERLKELRIQLVDFMTRYTADHPDVKKTKAEIAEMERRLEAAPRGAVDDDRQNNPAYIQLSAQLSSVRSDIESLKRQSEELKRTRRSYESRVASGPRVEEYYRTLMSERANTQAKYDDLMKKSMEAKVAYGMEKGQMGERFTLIDAARLPEKPVKPNIPAILIIGFILGIGAGVGTAALQEYSNQSAWTVQALAAATGMLVLGGVPEIIIQEDIDRQKARRITWIICIILVLLAALALFHFFVMDLDVFWARLMRRLAKL